MNLDEKNVIGLVASYVRPSELVSFFELYGMSFDMVFMYNLSDYEIDMCYKYDGWDENRCEQMSLSEYNSIFGRFPNVTIVGLNLSVGNMWHNLKDIFVELGLIRWRNLRWLRVCGEKMALDISVLNGCEKLRYLILHKFVVWGEHINFGEKSLRKLDLNGCVGVGGDINFGNSEKLRCVRLFLGARVGRLFGGDGMTGGREIRKLEVYGDVPAEFKMTKLRSLVVHNLREGLELGSEVRDLTLEHFDGVIDVIGRSLRKLKVINCPSVGDFGVEMMDFSRLESFEMGGICMTDFNFLRGCVSLRSVVISDIDSILNLDFLEGCIWVKRVHMIRCYNLIDIEQLGELNELEDVVFNECGNLRGDILNRCRNLRSVEMANMFNLRCGANFLGKLERVKIEDFEWSEEGEEGEEGEGGEEEENGNRLISILIKNCNKMKDLGWMERCVNLKYVNLVHCWDLKDISNLGNLCGLKKVQIGWCYHLKNVEGIWGAEKVEIHNCINLEVINVDGNGTKVLEIIRCGYLMRLVGLERLERLRSLVICDGRKLSYVSKCRPSLECVRIIRCPKLVDLDFISLEGMKIIEVEDCGHLVGRIEGAQWVSVQNCAYSKDVKFAGMMKKWFRSKPLDNRAIPYSFELSQQWRFLFPVRKW